MRIGIDCRTILNPDTGERAGVGHYTSSLVRSILAIDRENQYVLFFDSRTRREAVQTFEQENVTIRFLPFSSYRKFLPFGYSHILVAAAFLKARLDVLHGPANVIPLGYLKKTVITLHDLAIYHHPEWFPSQIFSTRLLVPQSLKRAEQIIAVSEASKNDALHLFSLPSKKITVIHEGADTEILPLNDKDQDIEVVYKLPKKFFLYVGTIEPRKNLAVLFEAWQQLQQHRPEVLQDTELLLAGGIGHGGKDIIPLIAKMKLEKSVRHLGYVPHNHKIMLLKRAMAFVFPSLYEGFGLPVLEAMQLGVPVIASNTSSIPEVAGEAALTFDPTDAHALAEILERYSTSTVLFNQLSEAGIQQAKKFSWEKTARQTLAIYTKVVQREPSPEISTE